MVVLCSDYVNCVIFANVMQCLRLLCSICGTASNECPR